MRLSSLLALLIIATIGCQHPAVSGRPAERHCGGMNRGTTRLVAHSWHPARDSLPVVRVRVRHGADSTLALPHAEVVLWSTSDTVLVGRAFSDSAGVVALRDVPPGPARLDVYALPFQSGRWVLTFAPFREHSVDVQLAERTICITS